jgi:hypothetical protein
MELAECTPGKAIYHICGFCGIVTNDSRIGSIPSKKLVKIIKTTGKVFWAYPESLVEHYPGREMTLIGDNYD